MAGSKSCALPGIDEEIPRYRKPHFFSSGLSGVNFSWSFVMRSTLLSASQSSETSSSANCSSTNSWSSVESCNSRSVSSRSSSSGVSSDVTSSTCSSKSSSRSQSKRSLWSFVRRKARANKRGKFVENNNNSAPLLDELPFTDSGKFLTVIVGSKSEQIAKYVISRSLLTHPLFQVMLKVSEDEFGKEYAVDDGVSIACDPDLFLEVVRWVDGNLQSVRNADLEVLE